MSSSLRARALVAAAAIAGALSVAGSPAQAAKSPVPSSCTISGSTVSATGLPTDQVINFLISDHTGTWGWVVGYSSNGSLAVSIPSPNGPSTYMFTSKTWGPNGSKYTVFASC